MAYTPFKFPQRPTIQQTLSQTPGYFGQLNMPVPPAGPATQNQGMLPSATPNAMPRNQKAAIIMGALSDIFRGQDPTQNTIARQQQFMAMDAQRKAQERFQKAYEAADPNMQKIMAPYSENPLAWMPIQAKLDIDKLTNTGIFPGGSEKINLLNILENEKNKTTGFTTAYKSAYDILTRPRTVTYTDERGQLQVEKIPGLSEGIYPNPFSQNNEMPIDNQNNDKNLNIGTEERKRLEFENYDIDRLQTYINDLDSMISDETSPFMVGEDRAVLNTSYVGLQMELKNFLKLGVLAGEALTLIEKIAGDPLSLRNYLLAGGPEGTKVQLAKLLEISNKVKNDNLRKLGDEVPVEQATQERVRITLD